MRCHVLVFLCLAFTVFAQADEKKSGVGPSVISLPSGPGSIEGLGESFEPQLNTGSSTYSISLETTPGIAGHQPSVSLSYNSGAGNDVLGIGWSLGVQSIQRQTDKGQPKYNGDDTFIFQGEELIPLVDGSYALKNTTSFLRFYRQGDSWLAKGPNGHQYRFGLYPSQNEVFRGSRLGINIETKISEYNPDFDHTYRWYLSEWSDTNGNKIEYYYSKNSDSNGRLYPSEIRYNQHSDKYQSVVFHYEDRPDVVTDYRSGFLIQTAQRLSKVQMFGFGQLAREYRLAYELSGDDFVNPEPINKIKLGYSQLAKVTQYGRDAKNYLPPLRLEYTSLLNIENAITSISGTPASLQFFNSNTEFMDVNADGLPDIYSTQNGEHKYALNQGDNTFGQYQVMGNAPVIPLSSEDLVFADMDGDAKVDLLHKSGESRWAFYRNRGNGEYATPLIDGQAPAFSLGAGDTRFSDINFDKKIDIVRTNQNGTWSYCLSQQGADVDHAPFGNFPGLEDQDENGNGQLDNIQWDCNGSATPKGLPADGLFQNPNYRQADMNGDRLQDFVWVRNIDGKAVVSYYPSKGFSNFDRTLAMTGSVEIGGMNLQDLKLTDINGDGLADLVKIQPSLVTVWFNQGDREWSAPQKYNVSAYNPVNTQIRFADLNGNGTQDLVWIEMGVAQSETIQYLDFSPIKANQLSVIDNGIGKRTIINYKSTTDYRMASEKEGNPWSLKSPITMQVVAKVTVEPGLDLDTKPGNDQYISEYVYRDAWYDGYQKEFRGFAFVKSISIGDDSAPTSVTRTFFHTGAPDGIDNDGDGKIDERGEDNETEELPLKGQVLAQETTTELAGAYTTLGDGEFAADKDTFQRVQSKLTIQRIHSSDGGTQNVPTVNNDQEVSFAYALETLTDIIELGKGTPKRLKATTLKDAFGNTLEAKNYGVIDEEGDEQFTFSEYINDIDRWMLGFIHTQTITDGNENRLSQTKTYYDGDDYVGLPLGQIEKGLSTRSEGWVEANSYIQIARSKFDGYGNPVSLQDARGHFRDIEYDTAFNTFPVTETIQIEGTELAVKVGYDTTLGLLTQSTDLNGHITHNQYDDFGRQVSVLRPGDGADYPSLSYQYQMSDPHRGDVYDYDSKGNPSLGYSGIVYSSVKTENREQFFQQGTLDSWTFFDGSGRELAKVQEDDAGYILTGAKRYNAKGRDQYVFEPIHLSVLEFSNLSLQQPHSALTYDANGRNITSLSPTDKEGIRHKSAHEYFPLETKLIDANGNASLSRQDGLERIVLAEEHNMGEIYSTHYVYDAMGNLEQVRDAQNNIKQLRYDGLNRKIYMSDPDRGETHYEYDHNNNLVKTTDNKNQIIEFTYDAVNRPLSEDYLGQPGIEVRYQYDNASDDYPSASNVRGALVAVSDLSGSTFGSFDNRGNSNWIVKRVNGEDYRFSSAFDAMDRPINQTWPDGESINYEYNQRGLLKAIPNFVNEVTYYSAGQMQELKLANGTKTHYEFDARQRLIGLSSQLPGQLGAESFQNLSYQYDGLNNIKKINDLRTANNSGLLNASQDFVYDDLYRLIHASGEYGAIAFDYDKIGNLIDKRSPAVGQTGHIADPLINLNRLSYGGMASAFNRIGKGSEPGPHAVFSTGSGLNYDYDQNGNMTLHGEGDQYDWDYLNRLTHVTKKNGDDITYTYDSAGQRISKVAVINGKTTQNLYISPGYEIRDGKAYKYVSAGSKRVARISGSPKKVLPQTIDLKQGWNFISPTLESTNMDIVELTEMIDSKLIAIYTFESSINKFVKYKPHQQSELKTLKPYQGYLVQMSAPAIWTLEGQPISRNLSLTPGWQLVGFPFENTTGHQGLLTTIGDDFYSVWKYSAAGWVSHFKDSQLAALNTLNSIEAGKAYWLNMAKATTISAEQELQGRSIFYHADHLGSTNFITDAKGEIIDTTEYYPFGRPRYNKNSDGTDNFYKYTGQELDKETGLSYHSARYLDPVIGRFISVDPMLAETPDECGTQGCNLYNYSINNPVNLIDPEGLEPRISYGEAMDEHIKVNRGGLLEFYPQAGVLIYYEHGTFVRSVKAYAGGNIGKAHKSEAVNNLAFQYTSNYGPAPVGKYMVAPAEKESGKKKTKYFALRMYQHKDTVLNGRNFFLIHSSGGAFKSRRSSQGCIIIDGSTKGGGRQGQIRVLRSFDPYSKLVIKSGQPGEVGRLSSYHNPSKDSIPMSINGGLLNDRMNQIGATINRLENKADYISAPMAEGSMPSPD